MNLHLKPFLLTALLALMTFSTVSTAFGSRACESLFTERILPEPLRKQIRAMEDGDYHMAVERITIDGRPRTIVLTGERHIKSKADTARFVRLMQHFEFKAVESIPVQKYWLPKGIYKLLQYERSEEMSDGSSITTVSTQELARTIENELTKRLIADIQAGRTRLEDTVTAIQGGFLEKLERAQIAGIQDPIILSIYDQLDFARVLRNIHTHLDSGRSKFKAPRFKTEIYKLEETYEPSKREKLAGAIAAISNEIRTSPTALLTSCAWAVGMYCLTQDPNVFLTSSAVLTTLAAIGSKYVENKAFTHFAAVDRRDENMTATLIKALHENPNVETILVVIGAAHMPGMVMHLRDAGSTQVAFRPGSQNPVNDFLIAAFRRHYKNRK